MKSITVILFIITVVSAKYNISRVRSILESKENFFDEINGQLHNITMRIFATLKHRFVESPRNKLYLSLQNELSSIAKKNYEKYTELKKISKPVIDNTAIKKFFSVNEVIKAILYKEIYGEPNIGIYDNNITSDIENSKEFAAFVRNFEDKINKLSVDDLFKQTTNDTVKKQADISEGDLKAWRPQEVLHNVTRRLYKGSRGRARHYPFVASIHVMGELMCAGSIISKDLVLTAASCMQLMHNNRLFRENPRIISVRVGSSYATRSGDLIMAAEVHFYPTYNPENLFDNLAIIRISRHIRFSEHTNRVKKILLDTNEGNLPTNVGSILVAGWGATDKTNIVGLLPKMSFSVLDVYHIEECKDIYSRYYVTNKHFCAGFVSKGGGACNKDAGGPGVVGGMLAGVISFGPPACGTVDAPTVFTRIGYYIDWIETIMELPQVVRSPITTLRPPTTVTGPQITPYIPTRGPVYPIYKSKSKFTSPGLRSKSQSMEAVLLKQILNEVIFSKRQVIRELMYEAPEWAEADFNDIITTKTSTNKPLSTLHQDYLMYGPMDEDQVFITTKRKQLLEHPLINKSLVFIPEKYGIYETTETTVLQQPTNAQSVRPWTSPVEDEATLNPLALRTNMDLGRNYNNNGSLENNDEYTESDSDEPGSNTNDHLGTGNLEHVKNMGRDSLRTLTGQETHNSHKEKQVVQKLTPVGTEDIDEEYVNIGNIEYDSLEEDRQQNKQMVPMIKNTPVKIKTTNKILEPNAMKHKPLKINVHSEQYNTIVTVPLGNVDTDEEHKAADNYRDSKYIKMYLERNKKFAATLENTTPFESESTDEEYVITKNYHKTLNEDAKTKQITNTNLKNKVSFESDHENKNIMNHEPEEDMYHNNNKMNTNLENKILYEGENSDEGLETEHTNHELSKEDIFSKKLKNALNNYVLFESENEKHGAKNMNQESLRESKNQRDTDNRYASPDNLATTYTEPNSGFTLDKQRTRNYEGNRESRFQNEDGSPNANHKNWNSLDTTTYNQNWDSREIKKNLNTYPNERFDKNSPVIYTAYTQAKTTNHYDHGARIGRTIVLKKTDNFEPIEY